MVSADRIGHLLWERRDWNCAKRGQGGREGFAEEVDLSRDLKGRLPFSREMGGGNAFLVERRGHG